MLANGWKALVILFVIHFFAYALVVKETWLLQTLQQERVAQHQFLGEEYASYSDVRAQNLFTRVFVNSGVMKNSFATMLPTEQQRANARGMENVGHNVFPWVEQRIRTWWTMVFQVFVRLSYAMMWWPFLVLALVPFVVDAWITRRVKSTTFALTSPHIQGIAIRALPVLVIGYFLLMFAPFYIPPSSAPVLIFVTCALLWFGVTHFVKRG